MTTPTLETKRLLLRPLAIEDADQIQALFPQWEVVQFLNNVVPWPYPPDGALTFIRDAGLPAVDRGEQWIWTLRFKTDPDRVIGSISLVRADHGNRGFWLGPEWHGQGLMTEAADAVTDFWFDTLQFPVLRVPKAIANTGSRRISEKQGMRVVAVEERQYVSGSAMSEIWEITAEEWRARRAALRLDPQRVAEARTLLAAHFGPTPLTRSTALSTEGHDVHLKIETGLPTGSFKVRGAFYSLSMSLARGEVREVVAASTGNHGAAVAYAARALGVPATIFVPSDPNPVKAARIRDLGAELIESGPDLSAAIDAAAAHAAATGALFLDDAAAPDVPIGTATIGAEILEQLPDVRTVFVPMGDTALVRGVASALKQVRPSIRVIGVVAAKAPAYGYSWLRGTVVETPSGDTIADGLAVRRPLAANVDAIRELVDDVEAATEEEMVDAIRLLRDRDDVVAEPAGAAATAALLKRPESEGPIVVLVTGGNIAPAVERAL